MQLRWIISDNVNTMLCLLAESLGAVSRVQQKARIITAGNMLNTPD